MATDAEYEAIAQDAYRLRHHGERKKAEARLHDGLDLAMLDGDRAYAYTFEGDIAWIRQKPNQALNLYMKAAETREDSSLILRNVAVTLGDLGRHEESIDWFKKALEIDPNSSFTLTNYAWSLAEAGHHQLAMTIIEKAMELNPEDPFVWDVKGFVHYDSGDYQPARLCFDKALFLDPEFLPAKTAMALLLATQGNKHEAADLFMKVLEKDPEDEGAQEWVVRMQEPGKAYKDIAELERRRNQKELERLRAEQEAQERKIKLDAWRSLSARSAHRIGNQLFSSRGALRTLKRIQQTEHRETVEDLEGCLDRIQQIVQEFQSFSANDQPNLLAAPIGPLIRQTVRRFTRIENGIKFDIDAADTLPACRVDRKQLDQALGELLENALHHTPKGRSIYVRAETIESPTRPQVRIIVEDTGPGIQTRDKERIFEPFVSARPGGTGLGLAIVRQIVENHGGLIRETGTPGKGARFEIDLPVAPADKEPQS